MSHFKINKNMQSRKILFVLNNSSSQKSIMSEAETLGALKADMRNAGIDYNNMTFYEGRTRTELKDDASVLPTNVPVAAKGTTPASTTNDLVFMLTTVNKKIRSGALGNERKEIMEALKAAGLSAAVTAKFGKNMTQCKTPELIAFLAENTTKPTVKEAVKPVVKEDPIVAGNTTLTIKSAGASKLAVVKEIKESLNLGLKEAKDLVDGVPSIINGLTKEAAECLLAKLNAAGAEAYINGDTTEAIPQSNTDMKARGILHRLLSLLAGESDLSYCEEYQELLDELNEPEEIEAPQVNEVIVSSPKSVDKLSQSDINDLFGGWAK